MGQMCSVDDVIKKGEKKRLLLHACCGPCLLGTLTNISPYFDVTVYFYNPNIMPNEEFEKRKEALYQVVSHFANVKVIVPKQNVNEYLDFVKGLENEKEGGKRCEKCFELRLQKTAAFLSEHKDEYDFFTTTLTISPLKNAELINKIGHEVAEKYGVNYLSSNFKKKDGYLYSTRLSKEWGIYRQIYCGCAFAANDSLL